MNLVLSTLMLLKFYFLLVLYKNWYKGVNNAHTQISLQGDGCRQISGKFKVTVADKSLASSRWRLQTNLWQIQGDGCRQISGKFYGKCFSSSSFFWPQQSWIRHEARGCVWIRRGERLRLNKTWGERLPLNKTSGERLRLNKTSGERLPLNKTSGERLRLNCSKIASDISVAGAGCDVATHDPAVTQHRMFLHTILLQHSTGCYYTRSCCAATQDVTTHDPAATQHRMLHTILLLHNTGCYYTRSCRNMRREICSEYKITWYLSSLEDANRKDICTVWYNGVVKQNWIFRQRRLYIVIYYFFSCFFDK